MNYQNIRMLVVAPDFPYPPNHGGRAEIWGRIKILASLGFNIDLISTIKGNPPCMQNVREIEKYVKRTIFCKRVNRIKDMFSLLPLQIKSRDSLSKVCLEKKYDILLLEGEYVWGILDNPTLRAKHIIIREHNNEKIYFSELSDSVGLGLRKLYYFFESYKFMLLETKLSKCIKNIMFISNEEWRDFYSKFPQLNSIFLPASLEDDIYKKRVPNSRKVLFIGSLFMVNNREAICWYIEKVHNQIINIPNYELIIAGNSHGESLEWLYKLSDNQKITIFDTPQDLEFLYDQSSIFINPMLHGAGVKVKTINAIKNGLAVVSTNVGNQGTGLRDGHDILIADEPQKFALHLRNLLYAPDKVSNLVDSAQKFLFQYYDQKKNIDQFLQNILNKKVDKSCERTK